MILKGMILRLAGQIQQKEEQYYKPKDPTPAVSDENKSDDASSSHSVSYFQIQSIKHLLLYVTDNLKRVGMGSV